MKPIYLDNAASIVGLAKATGLAGKNMTESKRREMGLRDYLISRILAEIPGSRLNGDKENRLPNNTNFSFYKIDGSALLYFLDEQGILVSSGSACCKTQRYVTCTESNRGSS